MIPLWGAFSGFILGAGLVPNAEGSGFLRTSLAWLVGVIATLIFGMLAFLYYEISSVVAMGASGVAVGTSVLVAIGAD